MAAMKRDKDVTSLHILFYERNTIKQCDWANTICIILKLVMLQSHQWQNVHPFFWYVCELIEPNNKLTYSTMFDDDSSLCALSHHRLCILINSTLSMTCVHGIYPDCCIHAVVPCKAEGWAPRNLWGRLQQDRYWRLVLCSTLTSKVCFEILSLRQSNLFPGELTRLYVNRSILSWGSNLARLVFE